MINEIIKLRRKGLSFRRIAKELDSTVGKVQYQWTKYIKAKNVEEFDEVSEVEELIKPSNLKNKSLRSSILHITNDELQACLISPNKILVLWQVSHQKQQLISSYYNDSYKSIRKVLRVYDVTSIIFNGMNAHQSQEIILPIDQNNWTIKGMKPNRCYCLEFGIKLNENDFLPLLRSNSVHMPRNDINQAGELKSAIVQFIEGKSVAPNWIEHVSTYSYYEKDKIGGE